MSFYKICALCSMFDSDSNRRRAPLQSLHQAQPPRSLHGWRAQEGQVPPRCARWRADARCGRPLPVYERQPSNTTPQPRHTNRLCGSARQPLYPSSLRDLLSTTLRTNTLTTKSRWPDVQQPAVSAITPFQPGAPRFGCQCTELHVARPVYPDAAIWAPLRSE